MYLTAVFKIVDATATERYVELGDALTAFGRGRDFGCPPIDPVTVLAVRHVFRPVLLPTGL